jgi:hypothetical protein
MSELKNHLVTQVYVSDMLRQAQQDQLAKEAIEGRKEEKRVRELTGVVLPKTIRTLR